MGLVLFVVIGAVIGWLAAAIEEVDEGVLMRIGIGMVGAFLGVLAIVLLANSNSMTAVTWPRLLFSMIGAIVLLNTLKHASDYEPRDTKTV